MTNYNSGDKNSYYFLDKALLKHSPSLHRNWKKIRKLTIPKSSKKISSKHWKSAFKSTISQKKIDPLDFETMKKLLEIARDPSCFLQDSTGKKLIRFRRIGSEAAFIDKCRNFIYPTLASFMRSIGIPLEGENPIFSQPKPNDMEEFVAEDIALLSTTSNYDQKEMFEEKECILLNQNQQLIDGNPCVCDGKPKNNDMASLKEENERLKKRVLELENLIEKFREDSVNSSQNGFYMRMLQFGGYESEDKEALTTLD